MLAAGATLLIIGFVFFTWGYSLMERYDWNPDDWHWKDRPGGYEGALYFGVVFGGIVIIVGFVFCLYGAVSIETGNRESPETRFF